MSKGLRYARLKPCATKCLLFCALSNKNSEHPAYRQAGELIAPNYFLGESEAGKGDDRLGIRSESLTVSQKPTFLCLHGT